MGDEHVRPSSSVLRLLLPPTIHPDPLQFIRMNIDVSWRWALYLCLVTQRFSGSTHSSTVGGADDLKEDKIEIPVTRQLKKQAQTKAQMQGRSLAAIMRAWLIGWSADRFPDPPNISEGVRSAPKGRKKKLPLE